MKSRKEYVNKCSWRRSQAKYSLLRADKILITVYSINKKCRKKAYMSIFAYIAGDNLQLDILCST